MKSQSESGRFPRVPGIPVWTGITGTPGFRLKLDLNTVANQDSGRESPVSGLVFSNFFFLLELVISILICTGACASQNSKIRAPEGINFELRSSVSANRANIGECSGDALYDDAGH